jgi:hypothetical protein
MKRYFAAAVMSAVALALSGPAFAQDKKAQKGAPKGAMKVLSENDKVRAYETTLAPGAENNAVPSSATRVLRVLNGGTLERTYADGKKEKVEYKAGHVRILNPSPAYTAKNIGKTEVKLYIVQVK